MYTAKSDNVFYASNHPINSRICSPEENMELSIADTSDDKHTRDDDEVYHGNIDEYDDLDAEDHDNNSDETDTKVDCQDLNGVEGPVPQAPNNGHPETEAKLKLLF